MVQLSEKANRCLQHYLAVYQRERQLGSNGWALNECLHHFLDQRPGGQKMSALERAAGLSAAPFWWDSLAVSTAPLPAAPEWAMRREMMSPSYTTKFSELWSVRAK